MKIDSQLIKKLREDRSWSQEHLATVAGLNLRTVQRIEGEGKASAESKMAIASALEVNVASLSPGVPTTPTAEQASANKDRALIAHVAIYLCVGTLLVAINVIRQGAVTWAKWPLIAWGLGLVLRWAKNRFLSTKTA